MKLPELVEHVLKTPGVQLAGKTPQDSIAARLYVEAKKPDGAVELVAPRTFRAR